MQKGPVTRLRYSSRWLLAVSDGPGPTLVEAFELPTLTLRHRREGEEAVGGLTLKVPKAPGAVRAYFGIEPPLDVRLLCAEREPLTGIEIDVAEGVWCVRGRRNDGRFVVRSGAIVRGELFAAETSICVLASALGTRIGDHTLVVFNADGRVMALDPMTGELVGELLLRV
jgi:hypothetical protein